VIGHLGDRVSALLDGQLSPVEAERAWAHVHSCHSCRDLVEREGWIKTRLAGLSFGDAPTPAHLKGSLASGLARGLPPFSPGLATTAGRSRSSVAVLGGSAAVGAAVVGMLVLGATTSGAPADRRPPVTSLTRPSETGGTVTGGLRLPTRSAHGGIPGVKMVP
jgi:anti-sigma factor RsiW